MCGASGSSVRGALPRHAFSMRDGLAMRRRRLSNGRAAPRLYDRERPGVLPAGVHGRRSMLARRPLHRGPLRSPALLDVPAVPELCGRKRERDLPSQELRIGHGLSSRVLREGLLRRVARHLHAGVRMTIGAGSLPDDRVPLDETARTLGDRAIRRGATVPHEPRREAHPGAGSERGAETDEAPGRRPVRKALRGSGPCEASGRPRGSRGHCGGALRRRRRRGRTVRVSFSRGGEGRGLAMKGIVVWICLGVAACSSGSSSGSSDSGSSDASAADDGGGASSGGDTGDAIAGNDGASGHGSSGSSSSSGGSTDSSAPVPRTDSGKTDQGCVTHADCAPGYFCYLGATSPTNMCGGPSGNCASCQGGTCPPTFECSCLLASLCSTNNPCTDDGKVIVCPQQPQGM